MAPQRGSRAAAELLGCDLRRAASTSVATCSPPETSRASRARSATRSCSPAALAPETRELDCVLGGDRRRLRRRAEPDEVLARVAALARRRGLAGQPGASGRRVADELERAAAMPTGTEASLQVVRCARGEIGRRRDPRRPAHGRAGADRRPHLLFDLVAAAAAAAAGARRCATPRARGGPRRRSARSASAPSSTTSGARAAEDGAGYAGDGLDRDGVAELHRSARGRGRGLRAAHPRRLEDLRLRLEERFDDAPGGITVIVHPTPGLARRGAPFPSRGPAGRRARRAALPGGLGDGDRAPRAQRRVPRPPRRRRGLARGAARHRRASLRPDRGRGQQRAPAAALGAAPLRCATCAGPG